MTHCRRLPSQDIAAVRLFDHEDDGLVVLQSDGRLLFIDRSSGKVRSPGRGEE